MRSLFCAIFLLFSFSLHASNCERATYGALACASCAGATYCATTNPCCVGPLCSLAGCHSYLACTGKGYNDINANKIPRLLCLKVGTEGPKQMVKAEAAKLIGTQCVAGLSACCSFCGGVVAAHTLITKQPK